MKKLNDLILKYSYMFTEIEKGQENLKKWHKLMEELTEAKAINDEIKIAQIMENQKEIGGFYAITFGFECDDGWYDLIDETLEKIQSIDIEKKVSIHQIKEKYGGLVINLENATEEMHDLTFEAEEKSYKICEICGKEGELCEASHWYKTVCNNHRVETTWDKVTSVYKPVKNAD